MNKIEIQSLTHYYGEKEVFTNLDFTIGQGRILGLLGKNGAGKSTIINILNGFLKPTTGKALILGFESDALPPKTRERIGILNEGHLQYGFLSIKQIEHFYSRFYKNWNSKPFWHLMTKMSANSDQKIDSLSCGQRSQVALGLLLAQNPEVLILDDFSMGLDPGYRRLFMDYLLEFTSDHQNTVLATSHIIQDMETIIDDVIILDKKKLAVNTTLNNFRESFKQYRVTTPTTLDDTILKVKSIVNYEVRNNHLLIFTYANMAEIKIELSNSKVQIDNIEPVDMSLEDAFIGVTGKY